MNWLRGRSCFSVFARPAFAHLGLPVCLRPPRALSTTAEGLWLGFKNTTPWPAREKPHAFFPIWEMQKGCRLMEWYEEFRSLFPALRDRVYLDIAHHCCPPAPVVDAEYAFLSTLSRTGGSNQVPNESVPPVREKIANFVGAKANEIAFIRSTADGVNVVAQALPLMPGDEVIVNDQDHPSNVLPWLALRKRGVVIRIAKSQDYRVPLESIVQEVTPRTRVVAISHVQHRSGFRCDLKALSEMCHSRGVWLVTDAIQSAGSSPLDVRELGVDAAAGGSYKHLLGHVGSGFLYCSEGLLDVMDPVYVGPSAVVRGNKDTGWQVEVLDKRDARRLEAGSVNEAGAIGLGAGLDLHFKYGPRRIHERILGLATKAAGLLRETGYRVICSSTPGEMSGLVSFKVDSAENFRKHLLANGIYASTKDTDVIRVSVHAYTLEWEIDRLAEVAARYDH